MDLDLDVSPEIPSNLRPGFDLRQRHFGSNISFHAPAIKRYETDEFSNCGMCSFSPISITGPACSLQCDHCRAQILRGMAAATSPDALWAKAASLAKRGSKGVLISGGSNPRNVVPMHRFYETMRRIKVELGMQVLVHCGFADEEVASGLKYAGVDSVMLDIIGSNETIHDVYHLPWASTDDYERTLSVLSAAGLPLSPHVVIGLHYGKIIGELHALEIISRYTFSSLVLVGLQPTVGTPMQYTVPPSPEQMAEVFVAARMMFPTTHILLGCERPYGDHKIQTDALALKAGLNGIAYPAEGILGLAKTLGLEVDLSANCCSLRFQGI